MSNLSPEFQLLQMLLKGEYKKYQGPKYSNMMKPDREKQKK